MTLDRRLLLKAAAASPLLSVHGVRAQAYPNKPIRIVVPASAGTSIDVVTRHIAEPLSKRLNTPVVIDNKPGAGGLLGYVQVAKALADGYTIMLTGIPLYLLPLFSESAPPPFETLRDFVPIARAARVPFAIVVPVDSPYRSLAELVQAMKAKSNNVTYSSQGVGSAAHLCSVILNDMSKTKAQHIGYKETTMAVTDVVGGRISFSCQTSVGVLPLVKSGKLRALAVTNARRWDELPDVMTVEEAGVPGFEMSSQLDFMAPAKTPEPVQKLLSDEIVQIAQMPQFKAFCARQVLATDVMDYKALGPEMERETARWKAITQLAKSS